MPMTSFKTKRVKFWFSILNNGSETGFRFVKGSHKETFEYEAEIRDGYKKPVFHEERYELNIENLCGNPGTFIVFNDRLLHGGYVTGFGTRVSCELTLSES